MFKKLALASALALAVVSTQSYAADAAPAAKTQAPATIAVVNLRLIMAELPQAKEVGDALQKEFGPRADEIKRIQDQGAKLEADLQKAQGDKAVEIQRKLASLKADFDLKSQALQEDSQKKQREAESKIGKLVQSAIDRIAKERGIDLVIRGESVVFASDAVDISRDVIEKATKLKLKSEVKKEAAKSAK